MGRVPQMSRVEVVVARYNEDVAWLEELGHSYLVYDKGENPAVSHTSLPNKGRESHTYLTHIVRNYDRLASSTVFIQANPFDHLDDRKKGDVAQLRSLIDEGIAREVPFKGFAWFKLKCDHLGRPHDLAKPENKGRWAGWGKDIPLGEVFEKLFDARFPGELLVRAPAGLFMASSERIRTRPLEFYAYALQLLEEDPLDEHNTGHAFERLWQHIFNGNTRWNKESYPIR